MWILTSNIPATTTAPPSNDDKDDEELTPDASTKKMSIDEEKISIPSPFSMAPAAL